jgi:hypothetical protein
VIQRGRRSAAALQLVESAGTVETIERPRPPAELTGEEVEVWSTVVGAEAADWFRPSQLPLLAQYCRHVVRSNRIAHLIKVAEAADEFDLAEYAGLLKMQERESRAIAMLATKMRLSQQSTYDKSKRKPVLGKRPWEG